MARLGCGAHGVIAALGVTAVELRSSASASDIRLSCRISATGGDNLVNMTDHDLLRRYLQEGAQDAFGELVRRHVDLVYSAARRQVRSTQLAEEVAQSVFVDLARNAGRLRPDQPLGAWLYVVTRRTAIDVIRRESRRREREQTAMEIAAMNSTPPPWPQVEPLLDEAMESLGDADRRAVLLRYFDNQPLRDVGLALGVSEDAAQKRIRRALEQLRLFFSKRGVAVGSAVLAAELSAHAVQAAPAALGATIASVAAALTGTAGPAAIYGTAKTIAMTTLQKTLLTATITLAVGTGVYEAQAFYRQRDDAAALRASDVQLQRELARWHDRRATDAREAGSLKAELAALQTPAAAPVTGSDPALESEINAWLERAAQLRLLAKQRPELLIPELQLLTDRDWLDYAETAKFETDADIRQVFRSLRSNAKNTLGNQMPKAIRAYLKAHDDTLPADPIQLAPFFDPPMDTAILQRYQTSATGKLSDVPARQQTFNLLTEKAPVDAEFDSRLTVGTRGFSLGSFNSGKR
jgi:RNA polymerase sigma factor (sigma-70 family)